MKKINIFKFIKKLPVITILFLLTVAISGCGTKDDEFISHDFFAMDTWMSVKIKGDFTEADATTYLKNIENIVRELENTFSVTLEGSELYKLNNAPTDNYKLENKALSDIMTEALKLEEYTDRAFCPLLYTVSAEWGFTNGNYKVPDANRLDSLLSKIHSATSITIDENVITRPQGIMFDLGAIAKGYATDCIVDYLNSVQINNAIINLGGNIYIHGNKDDKGNRYTVGITHPNDDELLGVVEVEDACVITSGNYERYFELDGVKYHHIIDSRTGFPADNELVSVTVIAKDASYADALSTALFVMGFDEAMSFWNYNEGFEMILVTNDNRILYTDGISDYFSCNDDDYKLIHQNRPITP